MTSTAKRLAERMRASIVVGEMAAGTPLRQDELARRYATSKIPVREALVQLRAEGLVTGDDNRGAVVARLSRTEVEELYAMRGSLEALAVRRAIGAITPRQLLGAESALRAMDLAAAPDEWPALNWTFHAALYAGCAMPRLLATLSTLHDNVARYLLLYLDELDFQDTSQREHHALLEAFRNEDTDAALAVLAEHLDGALHQTLTHMIEEKAP